MIVYYTLTKQTKRFVDKVDNKYKRIPIDEVDNLPAIDTPYILIIPSYEPEVNPDFYELLEAFFALKNNDKQCVGIYSGGNRNFAQLYSVTAKIISEQYDIPLLHEFEFQGTQRDINKIEEELEHID